MQLLDPGLNIRLATSPALFGDRPAFIRAINSVRCAEQMSLATAIAYLQVTLTRDDVAAFIVRNALWTAEAMTPEAIANRLATADALDREASYCNLGTGKGPAADDFRARAAEYRRSAAYFEAARGNASAVDAEIEQLVLNVEAQRVAA